MGAITRQLKSYARKGGEAFEPVDLRMALSGALTMMESQLRNRRVRLQRSQPRDPVMVYCDRIRLEQVIINLIRNAMDATRDQRDPSIAITVDSASHAHLSVRDNGRGIPVDAHPKFKHLSALEVILTTLHSGGKFGGKAYATSGGLHGVGSSVVNALSDSLEVEVARERVVWRQGYARGKPTTKLANAGVTQNRRGTSLRFHPDPAIFAGLQFSPARLYRLCRSKAYLFRGVQIRWSCAAPLAGADAPAVSPRANGSSSSETRIRPSR